MITEVRDYFWRDQLVARWVYDSEGNYIVPPIVFGVDGEILMGREVWEDFDQGLIQYIVPPLHDFTPEQVEELQEELISTSDALGWPLRYL